MWLVDRLAPTWRYYEQERYHRLDRTWLYPGLIYAMAGTNRPVYIDNECTALSVTNLCHRITNLDITTLVQTRLALRTCAILTCTCSSLARGTYKSTPSVTVRKDSNRMLTMTSTSWQLTLWRAHLTVNEMRSLSVLIPEVYLLGSDHPKLSCYYKGTCVLRAHLLLAL